jgi:hypothetical protein
MRKTSRVVLAGLAAAAGLALLLPVVALALPFWALSGLQRGMRALLAGRRSATLPWQEMMEFAPEVGWKPRGGLDARAHAPGTPIFHVRTDADGWRGPQTTIEDAGIVAYGDSFAFGHGCDEETFFANLPGEPRIKAIGANGYNMAQGLLWMRRHAGRLVGKTVVWLVFYGNDLYENLQPNMGRYRMPFVRGAGSAGPREVVTEHISAEPWTFVSRTPYMDLLAEICTPGPLSDRVFDAAGFLVAEAAGLCAEVGARLVLAGIPHMDALEPRTRARLVASSPDPSSCDPELPDRRLREICGRHGAGFLALGERLERSDYLEEDVHWSAAGNRKVAAAIREVAGAAEAGAHPRRGASHAEGARGGVRAASL